MSELMGHLLLHYKLGGKTLYYCNTNDGAGEIDVHAAAESPAATDDQETVCDSCAI
jgi:hypothetical protein